MYNPEKNIQIPARWSQGVSDSRWSSLTRLTDTHQDGNSCAASAAHPVLPGAGAPSSGEASGLGPTSHWCGRARLGAETECATLMLQHELLLISERVTPWVRCFPSFNNKKKKARTPSCFLHATHQKNHTLLHSSFFLGGMFYGKGHFFYVLHDLQKVVALISSGVLDYFLSFLHLPPGNSNHLTFRIFPPEKNN